MADFLTEKELARKAFRSRAAHGGRGRGRGRGRGGRGAGGDGGGGGGALGQAADVPAEPADDAVDDAFDARATHVPLDLEELLERGYTQESELSAAAVLQTRTGFERDGDDDVGARYAPRSEDYSSGVDLSLVFRTAGPR